jgi:hypothetical protein
MDVRKLALESVFDLDLEKELTYYYHFTLSEVN